MKSSTVALFNTRYEEGYDVDDEFYDIWSKLKTLSISNSTNGSKDHPTSSSAEFLPVSPASSKKSSKVSPVLDEILTYPDPMPAKVKRDNQHMTCQSMPKHLSREQMIQYFENKHLEKKRLEGEKVKRQEE